MPSAKVPTNQFSHALRSIRKAQGLSQEDFSLVSSRTYVSSLERGLKSPTLQKVDELAQGLGVHPLTLLTLAYEVGQIPDDREALRRRVAAELASLSP